MKQNKNVQLYAEPNNNFSGNCFSSGQFNESFYSSALYGPEKPVELQSQLNTFDGINPAAKILKTGATLFPSSGDETISYINPVKKINSNEATMRPFPDIYLKETAARLSDIELAIDNYDASMFHFVIHSLKGLFINMNMPGASRLTGHMEERAAENKWQDVKELLLKVKKITAQVVQSMQ